MFYSAEEIVASLNCPKCDTKFVDPRIIVPCCETLCLSCIESLTVGDEINCHFCVGCKHSIPPNGFASNKTILQLLDLRANEFYRGSNIETLKAKLARIQNLAYDFKEQMATSTLIVHKHCREVKTQIDLFVETKKQQLDNLRDELLKKIDSYEQECAEKCHNHNTGDNKTLHIDQVNQFVHELTAYLTNFKIDEDLVSQRS
jgi:hypothetical protein